MKILGNLVRASTLLWLGTHFALTVAYLLPPDPLRESMQPLIDATIGTYFKQNWGLFAPRPRSSDLKLLARPLTDAEFAAIPTQGLPADGWYDLAAPLYAAFVENRLTAYERVVRPHQHAVQGYLAGQPTLAPLQQSCQRGDSASCTTYEKRLQAARAANDRLFTRIGSAFYQDIARPGDGIRHIALRAREAQSVPWPERYTARRTTQDLEIGLFPIDRGVRPVGIYLRPGAD